MQADVDLSQAAAGVPAAQVDQAHEPARRLSAAIVTWLRKQIREHHAVALRRMAEEFVGELIAADFEAELASDSDARIGGRPRRWVWETRFGPVEVAIPRLRSGSSPPDWLLRPGRGTERVVLALLTLACIRSVPPARLRAGLKRLGVSVSETRLSALTATLNRLGTGFRDRSLDEAAYPYVALAARAGSISNEPASAVTAIAAGVTPDGRHEVLGLERGSEEGPVLKNLLEALVSRGLYGVRLVVADDLPELRGALPTLLPEAVWQLSPAALLRDVSSTIPAPAQDLVATLVSAVYDQADRAAVEAAHARLVEQLKLLFPEAAALVSQARPEMLAFAAVPRAHWSLLWESVPFELRKNKSRASSGVRVRPNLFVVASSASPVIAPPPPPPPAVEPPGIPTREWSEPPRREPAGRRPRPRPASPGNRAVQATPTVPPAPTRDAALEPQPASMQANRIRSLTSAATIVAAALCIAAARPGAWIAIWTLAIGLGMAALGAVNRQQLITVLFAVGVGATAVDYVAWRSVVANWSGWAIAAPLLAAEIFGALHTLGLQYTLFPATRKPLLHSTAPPRRPIFILIPTVDEGAAVLTPTIEAALEARRRYRSAFYGAEVTIAICNDARVAGLQNWRDVERLAHKLGVACITRTVPGGNKAGNLEHARQVLGAWGEALIAIFDADQIAKPDFLLKTVPPFADPTVGWVQTGQYYRNLDQPVARWANDQQALFYRVLCPGKEAHNAAFICGTNVVIRATALDQIGGLPQDSVTEDFAASIRLHKKWRSVYLTDVLAEGLGPMDLPAYLRQQRRWAVGTLGVLRSNWRDIFVPSRGGLRLEQRIQYGLACTHYLSGLRDLIYVVAPIAFLLTGIPAVHRATLSEFLWHFVPYWAISQVAFWWAGRGVTGLRGIVIGFGSFPVLLQALMTVVLGRRSGFMLTSKQRRAGRSLRHLGVYVLAIGACAAAIVLALFNSRLRHESVAVSVLWVIYDIALLGGVLVLGIADLQLHGRIRRALPGVDGLLHRCGAWRTSLAGVLGARRVGIRPVTLGRQGSVAIGALLVVVVLMQAAYLGNPDPVVLDVAHSPGQPVALGLSLPYEDLATRPEEVQSRLCLPITIIGRTQDFHDSFDRAWADALAASGRKPWITLQFGTFGPDGTPPLDSGLLAVANGVRDADIARWAQAIRSYGKPVYLTILLHVDRNWAATSAVAYGGIPEDVPRVWEHVQSIFKAEGDTNVGWVWAPADPAHDQAYAPPESTIDAVLQSMIRYPDTPWPAPAAVLSAVTARHPSKPIFVEVSAAGAPDQKAAWIQSVALAVASNPDVYALLYHDGSPDVQATASDNALWSVESDPSSLSAMGAWQTLVPTGSLPCQVTQGGA